MHGLLAALYTTSRRMYHVFENSCAKLAQICDVVRILQKTICAKVARWQNCYARMPEGSTKGVSKKKPQMRVNIRDAIRSRPEAGADRLKRLEDMKRTLELKLRAHKVRRQMLIVQNERHELEIEKMQQPSEGA